MSEHIHFPVNLLAAPALGSRVQSTEPVPISKGRITEIKIHWPGGCNGLVQVAVFLNRKQILPFQGFLALNDITPIYIVSVPCKNHDEIMVDFWNGDAINNHLCSVTIKVEEEGDQS